jgi:trehalose synthase
MQNETHSRDIHAYVPLIGRDTVARIVTKARSLQGCHIANVNSSSYGGGVATLLSSLTRLLDSLGITTSWQILQGSSDFFTVTKRIHNGLQGGTVTLTTEEQHIYEQTNADNALHIDLEASDLIIVHDPQPLPLITHYPKQVPWVWRCHVDLTNPYPALVSYLSPFIERYDGMIVSLEEYQQPVSIPQTCIMPALDPFTCTNQPLSEPEVTDCLHEADIPTDLPLVVQISRFDRWKDPQGVIAAFKQACTDGDARLVLAGNIAVDDPEGQAIFEKTLAQRDARILVKLNASDRVINALQRKAAVVLQKSLREGFGLTVAEAMWKGTPVIGGNVGGIRSQIEDGTNGFLVSSVEETAARLRQVLQDDALRDRLGQQAHQTVREHFLLTRSLEQYLDVAQGLLLPSQSHTRVIAGTSTIPDQAYGSRK